MKEQYKLTETKMQKALDSLKHEYTMFRAGRANPAILEKVSVIYYDAPTPINQLAAVSVPEPRTLLITPWDATALSDIEKAINVADIGVTPQNDGKAIRLNFPMLTEERRRELAKQIGKYAEEAKVVVRNIRRDSLDKYKDMKKDSLITEDDLKAAEKDIQTLTDKYCKLVDETSKIKEKEILEI